MPGFPGKIAFSLAKRRQQLARLSTTCRGASVGLTSASHIRSVQLPATASIQSSNHGQEVSGAAAAAHAAAHLHPWLQGTPPRIVWLNRASKPTASCD